MLLVRADTALQHAAEAHPEWAMRYRDDTATVFARSPLVSTPVDARSGEARPYAHFP